jgi:hypothetical protein
VRDPRGAAGGRGGRLLRGVIPREPPADEKGVTLPREDSSWEEGLRRLERAARSRARGERLAGPEARSPECEVCGASDVRWGALCGPCRERLRAAAERARG